MSLSSPLPLLYGPWIQDLLGEAVRGEPLSTCAACAQCAPPRAAPPPIATATATERESPFSAEGEAARDLGPFFEPDVKCCQFWPTLPNFTVGHLLANPDPALAEGRRTVQARIAQKVAVSPLHLGCPPEMASRFTASAEAGSFGQVRDLRCPHYTDAGGGQCTIWAYREAVCTTWFCRLERGAEGQLFWLALRRLLQGVERGLSRWCATELGLTPGQGGAGWAWGDWHRDVEGYYRRCADLVDPLSWKDIKRILGFEARVRGRELKHAHRVRQGAPGSTTPEPLQVRAKRRAAWPSGGVRLWGYSEADPIDLSAAAAAALDTLGITDRREAHAALSAAGAPDGTLERLLDLRILIDADPDDASDAL